MLTVTHKNETARQIIAAKVEHTSCIGMASYRQYDVAHDKYYVVIVSLDLDGYLITKVYGSGRRPQSPHIMTKHVTDMHMVQDEVERTITTRINHGYVEMETWGILG
jgi:hypothetical protein